MKTKYKKEAEGASMMGKIINKYLKDKWNHILKLIIKHVKTIKRNQQKIALTTNKKIKEQVLNSFRKLAGLNYILESRADIRHQLQLSYKVIKGLRLILRKDNEYNIQIRTFKKKRTKNILKNYFELWRKIKETHEEPNIQYDKENIRNKLNSERLTSKTVMLKTMSDNVYNGKFLPSTSQKSAYNTESKVITKSSKKNIAKKAKKGTTM